jgi:hypothetical protein
MKFSDIPQRLQGLLQPPDPIVINHLITYTQTNDTNQSLNAINCFV